MEQPLVVLERQVGEPQLVAGVDARPHLGHVGVDVARARATWRRTRDGARRARSAGRRRGRREIGGNDSPRRCGRGDPLPAAAHAAGSSAGSRGRSRASGRRCRRPSRAGSSAARAGPRRPCPSASTTSSNGRISADVVGLAAQPPADLGEQLRAARAREVVLRVGAGEARATVHSKEATRFGAVRAASAASTDVDEREDAVEPGDPERLDDRLVVAGDDQSRPRAPSGGGARRSGRRGWRSR